MLNLEQLSEQIAAYASSRVSLREFEDWFRQESEDVHLWGDEQLNEFVFSVEALFSERHFDRLSESEMRKRLQEEARRFASPFASCENRSATVVEFRFVDLHLARRGFQSPAIAAVGVAVALFALPAESHYSGKNIPAIVEERPLDEVVSATASAPVSAGRALGAAAS